MKIVEKKKVLGYTLLTMLFGGLTIAALLTIAPISVRIASLIIFAVLYLYFYLKTYKLIDSMKGDGKK